MSNNVKWTNCKLKIYTRIKCSNYCGDKFSSRQEFYFLSNTWKNKQPWTPQLHHLISYLPSFTFFYLFKMWKLPHKKKFKNKIASGGENVFLCSRVKNARPTSSKVSRFITLLRRKYRKNRLRKAITRFLISFDENFMNSLK